MASADLLKLSAEDLLFLLEIEKTGVLLKAGANMNMSAWTASRRLAKISELIGDACFIEVKGKLVATEFFKQSKPKIEQIVFSMRSLGDRQFEPAQTQRVFRLTSMMTEVAHVLGGVIPMMLKEAPSSRVDLRKHDNELGAVVDGKVDFAIVTGVDLPPSVHYLKLYTVDRVVLLRKDHPLTRLNRPLKLIDLMAYDRVTILTGRSNSWTSPEQSIFPYEYFMQHTRFTTSRFHASWEVIQNTDLFSICGWRASEIASRSFNLTALPLPSDAKVDNPFNVLIWADFQHKDPSIMWAKNVFSRWAKQEKARTLTAAQANDSPIAQYYKVK